VAVRIGDGVGRGRLPDQRAGSVRPPHHGTSPAPERTRTAVGHKWTTARSWARRRGDTSETLDGDARRSPTDWRGRRRTASGASTIGSSNSSRWKTAGRPRAAEEVGVETDRDVRAPVPGEPPDRRGHGGAIQVSSQAPCGKNSGSSRRPRDRSHVGKKHDLVGNHELHGGPSAGAIFKTFKIIQKIGALSRIGFRGQAETGTSPPLCEGTGVPRDGRRWRLLNTGISMPSSEHLTNPRV